MQMLQQFSKLMKKNNYLINSFQFTTIYHYQNEHKDYWRYSMDNHTYIKSYFFNSTYIPKHPMISKTENKSKGKVRERNNWHWIWMWKTSKEIKNQGPITDRKHLLWKIKTKYKVFLSSSQPILLGPLD